MSEYWINVYIHPLSGMSVFGFVHGSLTLAIQEIYKRQHQTKCLYRLHIKLKEQKPNVRPQPKHSYDNVKGWMTN